MDKEYIVYSETSPELRQLSIVAINFCDDKCTKGFQKHSVAESLIFFYFEGI